MKKKILKKGLIFLIVCILSIGNVVSTYAACSHAFNGSYETVKEPTCTESGLKVGRCIYCWEVVTSHTTPATGHSYVLIISTPTYALYDCTKCGHSIIITK